jgi:DNA polymerase I-like protein with 3'-5' exonuclease and polymerase domains
MSAIAFELTADPTQELRLLKRLIREVTKLGARFRICGGDVEIDRFDELPVFLREALQRQPGLLRSYLAADDDDEEALEFADSLGVEAILVETRAEARIAIRQLIKDLTQRADSEGGGILGLDIETAPRNGYGDRPWIHINADGALSSLQPEFKDRTGLDPHRSEIALMQLYAGGWRCFLFRGEALQLVLNSRWLRRQRIVAHNAGFELNFIRHHSHYRPPQFPRRNGFRLDCTAQAAGLLVGVGFGGANRSLANAAKAFLDLDVPKALQTSFWGAKYLSDGQCAYASTDAIVAWRLWPILSSELRRTGRFAAYELQRNAIPAVADMELRGLGFNKAEHARQSAKWAEELAEARHEHLRLTDEPSPSKPAEVRAWLLRLLPAEQLAQWPRTDRAGELSTESKHLKRLVHIDSARTVLALLAKAKLISTFGPKLADYVNPVTGRIHCAYQLAGTKAGRFSVTKPNLQQLPSRRAPEFKRCIEAAPGNVLVGGDWSQVEMRAAAWISGDPVLTSLYAEGRDIHSETAARIAGVPIDRVTPTQRQAAKPINFGSIYGISPRGLVENAFDEYSIELTEAEAAHALEKFFVTFRVLRYWLQRNYEMCRRRGYVVIGAGRVVESAWEPNKRLSFNQCCNLPIQGICADAMLRAIRRAYAALRAEGVRGSLAASVHDELLLDVHENDAPVAGQILKRAMVDAFAETFPGAPLTNLVEVKIGQTWADVK